MKNSPIALHRISIALACLAIFALPSLAQTYTVLTRSSDIYSSPLAAPPVQGFDGNFYGSSLSGGAYSNGWIYKLTPAGVLTVLYSFCPQTGCADGTGPTGLILGKDGNFYGSTSGGGSLNGTPSADGTIFKITPKGVLTTLYSFCGRSCKFAGEFPGPLVQAPNGIFFGATTGGGKRNAGTIFKVTTKGVLTQLYDFCLVQPCTNFGPSDGLVLGVDGDLYGVSAFHEAFFKMTQSGKLTFLLPFCDTNPCVGEAGSVGLPIQADDGNFYAVAGSGGSLGGGTIYQLTPDGQTTTLYNFCHKANCPNGSIPFAGLTLGSDGNFYGTTNYGGNRYVNGCGDKGCGTIFQSTPAGALTTLYKFCAQPKCADGSFPNISMVQGRDGSFYSIVHGNSTASLIYKLDTGLPPFVKTLPVSGRANATVIILGNNLTGTTEVAFNGATATYKVVSNTEISAKVPSGASTGNVTVTTPKGTLKSNVAFTVP
jgi:uncharacterized repeat protein (TIGR03803 family)